MRLLNLLYVLCFGIAVIVVFMVDLLDPSSTSNNDANLLNSKKRKREWKPLIPDDKLDNIVWFVQVSDLHISKFTDVLRGPDLIRFCKDYLSIIKPSVVLASGDLVDAKDPGGTGSRQYHDEWEEYRRVVRECRRYHPAKWLDVRGNHDSFDVPGLNSKQNLHRKYSEQGRNHATSYTYTLETAFGKYSFIAVDACPDPGLKRPFNFFGYLNEEQINKLQHFSEKTNDSELTIWFGHYPTSLIVQDPPGLRYTMRDGVAYLCGHLHTLHGTVSRMYTRHKTGTLELELGDWRDYRIFRVLAVDHGMLSFVDSSLGEWPIILVTNPKHALFRSEMNEPLHRITNSTHIRILVFHTIGVKSVSVTIDRVFQGTAKAVQGGPLYVLRWDPKNYDYGLHYITILVKDSTGEKKEFIQPFSIDGSKPNFLLAPRLILMLNIATVGQVLFTSIVFIYVAFIILLRLCSDIHLYYFEGESVVHHVLNSWLWKLWLTAKTDCFYYPLFVSILYVAFGPWFIGDFMEEDTGILFVWGLFVKGHFISGNHTFFYGFFQVMTFHIPLLLHISHTLDTFYCYRGKLRNARDPPVNLMQKISNSYFPFILLVMFQTHLTITEFPRAYGTKAFLLGPVRTGSVILLLVVQYLLTQSPLAGNSALHRTTRHS